MDDRRNSRGNAPQTPRRERRLISEADISPYTGTKTNTERKHEYTAASESANKPDTNPLFGSIGQYKSEKANTPGSSDFSGQTPLQNRTENVDLSFLNDVFSKHGAGYQSNYRSSEIVRQKSEQKAVPQREKPTREQPQQKHNQPSQSTVYRSPYKGVPAEQVHEMNKKEHKRSHIIGETVAESRGFVTNQRTVNVSADSHKTPADRKTFASAEEESTEIAKPKKEKKPLIKRKTKEEKQAIRAQKDNEKYKNLSADVSSDVARRGFIERIGKKKKLINIITASVIIGIIFVVGLLAINYIERIEDITVDGLNSSGYNSDEIIVSSGLSRNDSLIFIPKNKISQNIITEKPYIKTVRIARNFKQKTVTFSLVETADKYSIDIGGEHIWLDDDAKILSNDKKIIDGGKYELTGFGKEDEDVSLVPGYKMNFSDENKQKFNVAVKIVDAAEKIGLNISSITFVGTNYVKMQCDEHITICAKHSTRFDTKFESIPEIMSQHTIKSSFYIDLRQTNKIAYGFGEAAF